MKIFPLKFCFIVLSPLAFFAANVQAHGLMVDPPARNAVCGLFEKPDQATTQACVEAFANDPNGGYQFMSVLSHDVGRKGVVPLPNNVCGFDSEVWSGGATPWDTPTQWPTQPAQAGTRNITWNIAWGPHFDDTEEFRYWITKPDYLFDPTKPLTWSDFESEAFCVLAYDDSMPDANSKVRADKSASTFTTECTLPARTGHHVIYGEWGRNYFTYERFHGCIDLAFSDGPIPPSAHAQSLQTERNQSLPITLTGVDIDGQVVGFNVVSAPTHGQLSGTGAQRLFTPQVDFSGQDGFDFIVIDDAGLQSAPAHIAIAVKADNVAPVAKIHHERVKRVVTLHGHDSHDPDGDALSYSWDFGDGNIGTGPHIVHTYADVGTYTISLTVSDGQLSDTVSVAVTVDDDEPSGSLQCEYRIENEWNNGAVANVVLTNTGTTVVSDWQLNWAYQTATSINHAWSANISGANPYQAEPMHWNRTVEPGGSVSFGMQLSKPQGSVSEIPTLDGASCSTSTVP